MDLIDQLKVAVWMVGNIDTPEDKDQWWNNFSHLWAAIANDPNLHFLTTKFFEKPDILPP